MYLTSGVPLGPIRRDRAIPSRNGLAVPNPRGMIAAGDRPDLRVLIALFQSVPDFVGIKAACCCCVSARPTSAQVGAVLGREFPHTLLEVVAGKDPDPLRAGIAELTGAELLYQRGPVEARCTSSSTP